MTETTPQAVLDALEKLDASDQAAIKSYIDTLKSTIKELKGGDETMEDADANAEDEDADMPPLEETEEEEKGAAAGAPPDDVDFPPLYESGEDFDAASEAKQQAADLKGSGEWEQALEKYTEAVLAAPPSALLYANRATALLKLGRLHAAERDCDVALKENPDSAKALRVRGTVRKELGKFEEALADLSASQAIDFDENTVEVLKFLTEQHVEGEKKAAERRNTEQEKLKKRAAEIKLAQEEAKREAEEERASGGGGGGGGMPGGMPGGMGGMPGMPGGMGGMGDLFSDPEIVAALQKPKVQAAFSEMMSSGGTPDPAKMAELMSDPEVGPVIQKIMAKMGGGGAGGMPGMPGGAGMGGAADDDDDDDGGDIPDLEEIN